MNITHVIAAGLMAIGIGMSGASAQINHGPYPPEGGRHMDDRDGPYRDLRDRHDDRRGYNRGEHRGWDNGRRGYGRDDHRAWGHGRDHCRTEWRRHRRVRICR